MRALIVVDHGSRRDEANLLIAQVVALVQAAAGSAYRVYGAHMELSEPTLEGTLSMAVADGATEVVVVPYMLGPGRHALEDIPNMAKAFADTVPEVRVRVAGPLGAHPALARIVLDRAAETAL